MDIKFDVNFNKKKGLYGWIRWVWLQILNRLE